MFKRGWLGELVWRSTLLSLIVGGLSVACGLALLYLQARSHWDGRSLLLAIAGLVIGCLLLGNAAARSEPAARVRAVSLAVTVVLGVNVLVVLSQWLPPGEAYVENNVENITLRGVIMAILVVPAGVGALLARRWHPAVGTGVALGALVVFGCNFLLFWADLLRGF